jgi:aminoglycoside phosphotransferase (APT) family kinase protein
VPGSPGITRRGIEVLLWVAESQVASDYQEYLEQRHWGFDAPEQLVFRMVARATGEKPVSRAKVVRGNDNEVYLVATGAGADYVVRIRRSGEVGFAAEAWAIEECRKAGVPVAQVHLVGWEEHDGEQLEFMVQSRLPGRPLDEVGPELSEREWGEILLQAGQVLGKVHSVGVGGFYHRDPDGNWDFADWQGIMDSTVRDRSREEEWILGAGFAEEEFSQMIRLIERYREEFDCQQPVLCHGDFLPEHILVNDDLQICGVVDFGMYQGNHPIQDLAVIAMAETKMDLTKVLAGHPQRGRLSDRFEVRLHLHRLTLEMGFLAHHLRIQHYPEIESNRRSLRSTFDHLRDLGL